MRDVCMYERCSVSVEWGQNGRNATVCECHIRINTEIPFQPTP